MQEKQKTRGSTISSKGLSVFTEKGKVTERDLPSINSFPKWPEWPDLSQRSLQVSYMGTVAPGLEPCSAVLPGPKQRAGSGVEPPGLKWSPCRMPALEP